MDIRSEIESWFSNIRGKDFVIINKLYEMYNYIECNNPSYEEGYDKIAFYSKNGRPSHGCKQFGNIWRSKLGPSVIIEHELDWISGVGEDEYGRVEFIMKRKKI